MTHYHTLVILDFILEVNIAHTQRTCLLVSAVSFRNKLRGEGDLDLAIFTRPLWSTLKIQYPLAQLLWNSLIALLVFILEPAHIHMVGLDWLRIDARKTSGFLRYDNSNFFGFLVHGILFKETCYFQSWFWAISCLQIFLKSCINADKLCRAFFKILYIFFMRCAYPVEQLQSPASPFCFWRSFKRRSKKDNPNRSLGDASASRFDTIMSW